jgi:hypothetical protein
MSSLPKITVSTAVRFLGKPPWLHMDLSASGRSEGPGAVASDLTGFGEARSVVLLEDWLRAGA